MEVTCTQIPVHYFENAGANSGYLLISFYPFGSRGRLKVREQPPACVCVREGGGEHVYTGTEIVGLALSEVCNHQIWGFFPSTSSDGPQGALPLPDPLSSAFASPASWPGLQSWQSKEEQREPLSKLHPTGTPAQKPREKENLGQLKRLIFLFFLQKFLSVSFQNLSP